MAAADIDRAVSHHLASQHALCDTRPITSPLVPHAHHNQSAGPRCPRYYPPPPHPGPGIPQPSSDPSPAKPTRALLRPDSAAYVEPGPGTCYFKHAPRHHHSRHLSHPVPVAPPRPHSPWTDPGPSAQSRRPSIQPSELRSWQGDWRDREKTSFTVPSRSAAQSPDIVVTRSTYSDSDLESFVSASYVDQPIQKHRDTTLNSLLKLSTIAPIVSFACLFYTLPILLFLTLTSPLGLCLSKSRAFKNRTLRYLTPPLNLQRNLVHLSACPPPVSEDAAILPTDQSTCATTKPPSSTKPSILITIQILSPFIAVALMFTSWVVACFWALSALIQDDAVEKKTGDDDGKTYAKKIVGWWQRWLDGLVLDSGAKAGRSSRSSGSSRESRTSRPEMRERR